MFNRDLMNNARPANVAGGTITILDRLQHQQPHVQVMAAAALFVLVCEHWNVRAQDVMTATKNLMVSDQGEREPAFEAVRMYLKGEF